MSGPPKREEGKEVILRLECVTNISILVRPDDLAMGLARVQRGPKNGAEEDQIRHLKHPGYLFTPQSFASPCRLLSSLVILIIDDLVVPGLTPPR